MCTQQKKKKGFFLFITFSFILYNYTMMCFCPNVLLTIWRKSSLWNYHSTSLLASMVLTTPKTYTKLHSQRQLPQNKQYILCLYNHGPYNSMLENFLRHSSPCHETNISTNGFKNYQHSQHNQKHNIQLRRVGLPIPQNVVLCTFKVPLNLFSSSQHTYIWDHSSISKAYQQLSTIKLCANLSIYDISNSIQQMNNRRPIWSLLNFILGAPILR